MLTVEEAICALVSETPRLPAVAAPLSESLGLVLAENVFAEIDSPPFDKALMDGYAVRSADLPEGRGRLRVVEEVVAGGVPRRHLAAGEATRIMTGAPLPAGADAVVQVERTRLLPEEGADGDVADVVIESAGVSPGQNILPRGASIRTGALILEQGKVLRPQELGCLAELGRATIQVYRRPRVAVLATGDELVPIEQTPGPGQIRNSNEAMLAAQLRRLGVVPVPLGIARDNRDDLREKISAGLSCDMLLLSGGVSAGKLDLVPSVLDQLGARQVFHKVRLKPGQPIWFGVFDRSSTAAPESPAIGAVHSEGTPESASPPALCNLPMSPGCPIFGLPGNPVSSMVCCELFARTALRKMMGIAPCEPVPIRARLARDYVNRGNRPTYHPAFFESTDKEPMVNPVRWIGSADLSATVAANAMALFPEGDRTYAAGTIVDVFPW